MLKNYKRVLVETVKQRLKNYYKFLCAILEVLITIQKKSGYQSQRDFLNCTQSAQDLQYDFYAWVSMLQKIYII